MKYIVYLFFLNAISCQSKLEENQNVLSYIGIEKSEKNKLETWNQYSTIDSIPKILLNKLNKLSDNEFKIANSKEDFQVTDDYFDKKLPWRQLRYLGKYENFWIMTYKHGGVGIHYHFIISQISQNEIKLFKTGVTLFNLETISEIKQALADRKINFKQIEKSAEIDII